MENFFGPWKIFWVEIESRWEIIFPENVDFLALLSFEFQLLCYFIYLSFYVTCLVLTLKASKISILKFMIRCLCESLISSVKLGTWLLLWVWKLYFSFLGIFLNFSIKNIDNFLHHFFSPKSCFSMEYCLIRYWTIWNDFLFFPFTLLYYISVFWGILNFYLQTLKDCYFLSSF